MKHYETVLPEGYREMAVIDAKDKKTAAIFTVVSLVITVAITSLGVVLGEPIDWLGVRPWELFLFAGVMLLYIVLHELVHGAAYKLLTGQKLTFGMTLTVAFCGVPTIYVYRKAAMIALLSPFVVFTLVFGGLIFLPNPLYALFFTFMLGLHIGGCCGDLYVTGLYLFQFKDPTILMQDTGPKQTFYSK